MLGSPIEEIKNRLDIVEVIRSYIKLQKAGANFRAVCPFHSEKTPSFFVSPARQIWHCFGSCGEGGDIFKFVMKIEGIEFGDALRLLAQKAGVELKKQDPKLKTERQRLYEICELATCFFEKQLRDSLAGKEAKKYLLGRGLKEETLDKWRLGYAPDVWQGLSDFLVSKSYKREEIVKAGLAVERKTEKTLNNFHTYDRFRARIIFPVFDFNSRVIGFGGRIFRQSQRPDGQEEAKYINIPNTLVYDKRRVLYGLNKAGLAIRKQDACILVEGYIDVIMLNQAGFENVAATSGTALSFEQLNILKRYSDNLLTAFDMDLAGDSATKRGIDRAQARGFNIKVIIMPDGKDPADIIFQNPGQWQDFLTQAKSIHGFYFENTLSRFDKNKLEGKKEISRVILPVIKRIPNKIEQSVWIQDLARVLAVKEEDVLEELKKVKNQPENFFEGQEINRPARESVPPEKTRKEILEERLLVLIRKYPEIFNLILAEDLKLFSPSTRKIIDCFQDNNVIEEGIKNKINELSLKAEIENIVDAKKEFQDCLRAVKSVIIRDKLNNISKEIKKAEEGKNPERIQELIQQFNQVTKSRGDLEILEI
ncbi:MAG: DNA primase [Candidatus Nealsonbacteria bacterium]|nr:DNA primase [Candidatus Nealsonbacteria bacterium]